VKRGDLVVATQGRSYWILDDLSPLRQLADGVDADSPHLFQPRPAVQWLDGAGARGRGAAGSNPPYGAVIHYVVPENVADSHDGDDAVEVKLELLDAAGEVLRTLSSTTAEPQAPSPWRMMFPEMFDPPLLGHRAGANRYVWNLRLPDARLVDDAVLWGFPAGPQVPPGAYTARLTMGDWTDTVRVDVVPDPRSDVAVADLEERYRLARAVYDELDRSHDVLRRIRRVRDQAQEASGRVDDEPTQTAVAALVDDLDGLERRIHQVEAESSQDVLNYPPALDNQLLYLMSTVESATGQPTDGSRTRFAELEAELNEIVTELDAVLAERLPALEQLLQTAGATFVLERPGPAEDTSS
jgi:hypothetical protein